MTAEHEKCLKDEEHAKKTTTAAIAKLHDLKKEYDLLFSEKESLEPAIASGLERLKRSKEKLDEQDEQHKTAIADAESKLVQKKTALEKELQVKMLDKKACEYGMEDSVVKTKKQLELELQKHTSELDGLKEKEIRLKIRFEDLEKKVEKQKRKCQKFEDDKKIFERLMAKRVKRQDQTPSPQMKGLIKTTKHEEQPKPPKMVTFDLSSLSDSSFEEDRRLMAQVTYLVLKLR